MKTKILTVITFNVMTTVLFAQSERFEQTQKNTMDGTKYGMKSKITGQDVIPAVYDKIIIMGEGKFGVLKDGKTGAVDSLNNIVVPIKYASIQGWFEDGRTFVSDGQKWAMIDNKGKLLTQFLYEEVLGYSEGVARVSIDGKTGYINSAGLSIIPCKYQQGFDCSDGLIIVYAPAWISTGLDIVQYNQGQKAGRANIGVSSDKPIVFNKKGIATYIGDAEEKVKIVSDSGKIIVLEKYIVAADRTFDKVIDRKGRVLIPYDNGYSILSREGCDWLEIKAIGQGWVYGILSNDGRILLKPNFKSISDYTYNNNEFAKVTFQDGSFFYIDKTVKCVEFDNQKCPQ